MSQRPPYKGVTLGPVSSTEERRGEERAVGEKKGGYSVIYLVESIGIVLCMLDCQPFIPYRISNGILNPCKWHFIISKTEIQYKDRGFNEA